MNATLMLGDCLKLMKDIPDNSIDMVLCDLPYGITRCKWDCALPLDQLWEQYNRIVKENGAVVLFGAEPFSSYLRISNIRDYKYDWVWDKVVSRGFLNAKKQPLRGYENLSVFYKKQCTYHPQITHGHTRKVSTVRKENNYEGYNKNTKTTSYDSTDRYPRNIIKFSTDTQKSHLHPTQKPLSLCEYMINTYTDPGNTVLDNCMGSATTGVACMNLDRDFIGMELEEKYFEISVNRMKENNAEEKCNFTLYKEKEKVKEGECNS